MTRRQYRCPLTVDYIAYQHPDTANAVAVDVTNSAQVNAAVAAAVMPELSK